MIVDIVLVLVLAAGFMLGFFRGLVRQAMVLGAWFVLFVGVAYVRIPLGEWLASATPSFGLDYASMLAYLALFFGLFGGAVLLIELGGGASRLTRHPILDDALGGVLGLLIAALSIAALIVILDSYFMRASALGPGELVWLRDLQRALDESTVARLIGDLVVRPLGIIIGPLLPPPVRSVMV